MARQRSIIFIVTTVALCAFNVVSLFTQPLFPVAQVSAVLTAGTATVLFVVWCFRKVPPFKGLAAVLLLSLGQNIVEYVSYVQHYEAAFDIPLIVDILTTILLVMAALVSYLRYVPLLIASLSLLSYVYLLIRTDSPLLTAIFPVYVFILVAVIVYDSLTGHKNMLDSMVAMLRRDDADRRALNRRFPEFSETQLSIASLIIQDKTVPEICNALGKTEGNVTVQRSRIRSKLGLRPEDNLREALLRAISE